MSNLEQFGAAFFPPQPRTVSTAYGTVQAVNADGSYQVKLNASGTTRCARLCNAAVDDTVFVVIQENGKCAAIGKVGGEAIGEPLHDVLYDDANGTTGTVALSSSAANYKHMRIFYKKNADSNACGSVDVYEPNGKTVSMTLVNPYDATNTQFVGRAVTVSGTSITATGREGYMNTTWQTTTTPSVCIFRVEAW